jgi:hypothetical protein
VPDFTLVVSNPSDRMVGGVRRLTQASLRR